MYNREESNSPHSSTNGEKPPAVAPIGFQLSEALDLSAKNSNLVEDMRKTPSPSHRSIYSESSPSISIMSSPGKCSDLQIGRFNLSGLNLLPRNLLTPTASVEDRMSPRSLVTHMKREIGESNPLVNLNMEQSIPIPASVLLSAGVNGYNGGATKATRPFKAYPHDPKSILCLDSQSAEKYNEFRKRMIEQIYAANGGQPTVSNPKMRRTTTGNGYQDKKSPPLLDILSTTCSSADSTHSTPTKHSISLPSPTNMEVNEQQEQPPGNDDGKSVRDSAYYERRRKNNAAAKKSRDRRRIKEDEIAIRAAFLERENIELKFELATARKQLALYGMGRV